MPNVLLSTKAVGSTIKLNVRGTPRNFIVVQQGRPASGNYDTSFNNVTWLLMQDIYDQRQWTGSGNDYANSSIHSWLNNASSGFLSLLDADIRAVIPTVKIPYRPGSGISTGVSSGANGLACKAFLLSMLEVGLSPGHSPSEGATLTYFTSGGNARRIANYNGSPSEWWTRSPDTGNSGRACSVRAYGTANAAGVYNPYGCRPVLPLPSNLYVSDDGSILTNEPPTAPGSIDVTNVVGGQDAIITLTAATDPDGTIANYRYEHKVDSGNWTQFFNANSLTATDSIDDSWTTVTYRAAAVDDEGAQGPYVTSAAYTVVHNQPPTAPGSIDVTAPVAGQPVTVTPTAATDPDGTVAAYVIERWVDSVYGGYWLQVQNSAALTFTETVGADWQSVQYRAAAVDDEGAQGPYIESEVLPVRTGAVTLTGPASGQGEHAQPFDLGPITLGLTPAGTDSGIAFAVLLDGAETVSASQAAGDEITLRVDPRVMARGAHTITVTASKEAYTTAMAQYTYTVPAWDGSDIAGGKSGRFEDHLGNKLLPKTLAQDSLGPGGADMATLIAEAQAAAAAPLEPVVKGAPPSGSYALSPGVLYDFTQADATALTFTFEPPGSGKAAAYHVMFKSGSTAATVTLPEGVKTPDGYVIEAGRVYELSVLEGLLTYQSWEADA